MHQPERALPHAPPLLTAPKIASRLRRRAWAWQAIKTNVLATGPSTTNTGTVTGTNENRFFRLGMDPIR